MTNSLDGMVLDDAAFQALLGKQIGNHGSARDVFEHLKDDGLVIKVSKLSSHFANWTEWMLWLQIRDEAAIKSLFGECVAVSASGKYLIMERLDDPVETLPKDARTYSSWLTDIKASAFGVNAAGAFKLRDYNKPNLGFWLAGAPMRSVQGRRFFQ